jgi:Leucine Rich repeat
MADVPPSVAPPHSPVTPQLRQYFDLCDQYRVQPQPSVVLTLTYPAITYVTIDKAFSPADLIPLVEVLKLNTTVTSLDLRRCKIGSLGCYALKDLLEHNGNLKQLCLNHNDVGEHGAQALAEGMFHVFCLFVAVDLGFVG